MKETAFLKFLLAILFSAGNAQERPQIFGNGIYVFPPQIFQNRIYVFPPTEVDADEACLQHGGLRLLPSEALSNEAVLNFVRENVNSSAIWVEAYINYTLYGPGTGDYYSGFDYDYSGYYSGSHSLPDQCDFMNLTSGRLEQTECSSKLKTVCSDKIFDEVTSHKDYKYGLSLARVNYTMALKGCQRFQGDLAVITTEEENEIIHNKLLGEAYKTTGLREGFNYTFLWERDIPRLEPYISNKNWDLSETKNYSNWEGGKRPQSNVTGCITLVNDPTKMSWRVTPCDEYHEFICKWHKSAKIDESLKTTTISTPSSALGQVDFLALINFAIWTATISWNL